MLAAFLLLSIMKFVSAGAARFSTAHMPLDSSGQPNGNTGNIAHARHGTDGTARSFRPNLQRLSITVICTKLVA